MSRNPEVTTSSEDAVAVDAILARHGIRVSAAERERLIRFYPLVREWMEQLRLVEARYEETALIYPAAPRE
ncbi:MAG TPA: hypothetical protein VFH48_25720 [Chloroflexota bacterium]|nr:hypothetical protein [Chloroflexota bacterium]